MKLLVNIQRGLEMLPHFIRHYDAQGATEYLVGVLDYGLINAVIKAFSGRNVQVQVCAIELPFTGPKDSEDQDRRRRMFVRDDEWYIVADLDEFHEVPGMTIADAAKEADARGFSSITGKFVDRLTRDGSLPDTLSENIMEQFPRRDNVTERIGLGQEKKVICAKGYVPITSGHHFAMVGKAWNVGLTHHFKWWGDITDVMTTRAAQLRKLGLPWGQECERFLAYLEEHGGKLV